MRNRDVVISDFFVQVKSQFTTTHTQTHAKNGERKKCNRWVRTPTKYRADLITFFVGTSSKCQLLLSYTRTHAHPPTHPLGQSPRLLVSQDQEPYGHWPLNVALNKGQAFLVALTWVVGLEKDVVVSWPSAFQGEPQKSQRGPRECRQSIERTRDREQKKREREQVC